MTKFIPNMAVGHLFLCLLCLFYAFQNIKAHDPPQPSLTVSPTAIREKDSVQLICETPPSASVSHCYFTLKGRIEFPLSTGCQWNLTGNHLVKWTGQESPAVVKIQCQYSATNWQYRSIYSGPSTVTIQDDPQLTVSPTAITERDSVQLICETPPSLSVSHCYFNMGGGSSLPDSSCKQSVTGTQLLTWAGQPLPAVVQVKCYYTVFGRTRRSPFSNQVSVTIQDMLLDLLGDLMISDLTTESTSSTAVSAGSTVSSHSDSINPDRPTTSLTSPLTPTATTSGGQCFTKCFVNHQNSNLAVGVASGVGGFLLGLTAVCLCKKTKKNNSQRPQAEQDDHNESLMIGDISSGGLVSRNGIYSVVVYLQSTDPPQPSLTVSPTAIREKDSVQLICETPPSASGSQCYFTFKFVEFPLSTDCQQTLTGNDLVKWTGQSSPAVVKMQCQYSVTNWKYRSIYSEPSTVTIQDDPQLTVSPTVITERDSVQLICETPASASGSPCYFNMGGGSSLPDSSCKQSVTGTQLLTWAGQSLPAVVQVKCYYTVFGRTLTSPFSNQVSVTIQAGSTIGSHLDPITSDRPTAGSTVSSTLTTGTPQCSTERGQISTESFVNSNHQKINLVNLLWLAGVGVFLLSLIAVCFCRKTC
ncbi:hypothetical protein DPEC_G00194440 [Dallia pectoralis]|uniref:Uncharacterized protein n=1 Tax=Dallia pectoralis TaxID=75939 RepID=A0ACC2G7J6_DALPE|nr:hypothetical protein DPEC_G00194440 [Dallia pectoralis]